MRNSTHSHVKEEVQKAVQEARSIWISGPIASGKVDACLQAVKEEGCEPVYVNLSALEALGDLSLIETIVNHQKVLVLDECKKSESIPLLEKICCRCIIFVEKDQ